MILKRGVFIFHRPDGRLKFNVLHAQLLFYTPRASDYRLISKTACYEKILVWPLTKWINNISYGNIFKNVKVQHQCAMYFSFTAQQFSFLWVTANKPCGEQIWEVHEG